MRVQESRREGGRREELTTRKQKSFSQIRVLRSDSARPFGCAFRVTFLRVAAHSPRQQLPHVMVHVCLGTVSFVLM
jgi:hypothetical protein